MFRRRRASTDKVTGTAVLSRQDPSSVSIDEQVHRILADVVMRRAEGATVSEESVIAEHPSLAGRLREAFGTLNEIKQARLAAERAGAIRDALAPLSHSDLDRPIDVPSEAGAHPAPGGALMDRHVVIAGYRDLTPLSGGGQATVYRAVQERTGRPVAIKVLRGGPFVSSQVRARFEREVDALAQLSHPHIVQVLDRGRTVDGSFYLTMEFIDGPVLDAWIAAAPDLATILRMFAQVADAMDEAHRRGIVHRDLKPSNVRVDGRGEPHVLDFGLARATGQDLAAGESGPLTLTGQLVGSLPWSSPEQAGASADPIGPATDIYALGVMLYHALTSQFPYPTDGPVGQVLKHIESTLPPRPSRVGLKRPSRHVAALDGLVLRALEKDPNNRFASAAELRDALRDLAEGRTLAVPAIRAGAGRSRRRLLVLTAGGLLAVGIAVALGERNKFGVIHLPSHVNTAGMTLVKIPAGDFHMGSPVMEEGREWHERRVPASLETYWIGTTEVTRGQFAQVMQQPPPPAGTENLPIDDVSVQTARDFCARLSEREGRTYRLPTEAEWEYACRAGTASPISGTGNLDDMGWYSGNAGSTLHPVGEKLPNNWGLHDMHGNVSELTDSDWFERLGAAVDPREPRDLRVVRGGNSDAEANDCRSASRGSIATDQHWPHLGFRIVMVND